MIEAIKPAEFPWFDYSRYTFSLGLALDGKAWLSGHSASEFDPDTKHIVVRGGMSDQARTSYAKIEAILDGAGLTLGDVHRVVEYVTAQGMDHYAEAAAVRDELFGSHRPAVCTVVVNRLLRPQAFIEIEVTGGPPGSSVEGAYAADGITYLSSITAPEAGDDLVAQNEACLRKAVAVLEAAGLTGASVVKTVDYTTPATRRAYPKTGRARKEMLGPVYPAAAGILLSRLQRPGALISLDVIASRETPVAVNPGWERYAKLTYNPAVRAGDVLFMSGQAALDPATEQAVFEGDVVAQAEYTYENVIAVLRAAGAGPEHLVKTIEYVVPWGLPKYRDVAKVREQLLRAPYPASTGCVCEALLRDEFLIEVDPLAVLS